MMQKLLKTTLFIALIVLSCRVHAQETVYIPDTNFKSALLANSQINTNGDDEIQKSETLGISKIDVTGSGVSNPTGFRAFEHLTQLIFDNNNITSLDVSGVGLDALSIANNNLSALTLGGIVEYLTATGNPNLSCIQTNSPEYYSSDYEWGEVDEGVTFNTVCPENNPEVVFIPDTVFKAALITDYQINTNQDDKIQVSEAEAVTGELKVNNKGISDLSGIEAFVNVNELKAHYNSLTTVDLSMNTSLQKIHLQGNSLTSLDLSSNSALSFLRAQDNQLSSLDLSTNSALRYLDVQNNDLESLNIQNGNNDAMYGFNAAGNSLECIQVDDPSSFSSEWSGSKDPGAEYNDDCSGDNTDPDIVYIPDANFKSALLANTNLNTNGDDEIQVSEAEIYMGETPHGDFFLNNLGIKDLTGIKSFRSIDRLYINGNDISYLDLSGMTNLKYLEAKNCNMDSINLQDAPSLGYFNLRYNSLTSIDFRETAGGIYWLSHNLLKEVFFGETVLEILVDHNKLTSLDISRFDQLSLFSAANNLLTEFKSNPEIISRLSEINLANNEFEYLKINVSDGLEDLNISNNTNLQVLNIQRGPDGDRYEWRLRVEALNTPNFTCVEVDEWYDPRFYGSIKEGVRYVQDCSEEEVVYIPDPRFKVALLSSYRGNVDTNGDEEVQVSEAEAITGELSVHTYGISDLTGIEAFKNITKLKAHGNALTSVNLSENLSLVQVHLQDNELTTLDLSANSNVDFLRIEGNALSSLDLSGNSKLRYLNARNNQLTNLNIQNGNNSTVYNFNATGNPDLNCVQVDDPAAFEAEWGDQVDPGASFSTDCSGSSSRVAEAYNYSETSTWKVYPNPTSGKLNISQIESIDVVEVYDVSGRKATVSIKDGQLDLSHLRAGTYLLKATRAGHSETRRIVKK